MVIENAMYFTLGFLAAALLAIAIGPAFWRRAVRLTKRRIEAATPVTLAEFRADKDKLRAEFAITLRKHQLKIDALRNQISGNVVALDAAMSELGALRTERDEQFAVIGSLQTREQELVARIRDIERDAATLAARLRQADVDYSDIDPDLLPEAGEAITAEQLTGDYRSDVEDLLTALNIERQRNGYLEDQTRMLLARLEKKKKSGLKDEAIAMLRDTLSQSDSESEARLGLRRAEARISGAESRLSALLTESAVEEQKDHAVGARRLLAEDFSEAEQSELLRTAVAEVEEAIMKDWDSARFDAAALRSRLETIAADVSRLVYAGDAEDSPALTESLFDKVRKFAADSMDVEDLEPSDQTASGGSVSDRMLAMRDRAAQ